MRYDKCKTLFATHYHHLNDLERQLDGVKNYRIAVREDGHRILWLRKIVRGGTDKSYGIQVARLAGLPPAAIERAKEVLAQLEGSGKKPATVGKVERVQLTLFEAEEPPLVKELRELDTDALPSILSVKRRVGRPFPPLTCVGGGYNGGIPLGRGVVARPLFPGSFLKGGFAAWSARNVPRSFFWPHPAYPRTPRRFTSRCPSRTIRPSARCLPPACG